MNYGTMVFGWLGAFLSGSSFIWIILGVTCIIPVSVLIFKSVLRCCHHV